jgi:hypothetical protein
METPSDPGVQTERGIRIPLANAGQSRQFLFVPRGIESPPKSRALGYLLTMTHLQALLDIVSNENLSEHALRAGATAWTL